MSFTLLIMAAGLGSRFGGTKQLVEVGPAGEAFFDFAIRDAVAAGAADVVMIVRTDIEDDVRAHVAHQHPDLKVRYVCQDTFGPPREKPWGTAHAVLAAGGLIDRPFMVVNADDYYGPGSYQALASAMAGQTERDAYLVAFELGRTLPAEGTVSRGVCEIGGDDRLTGLVETHGIGRVDETIRSDDPPGELGGATPVSMNMFGLHPGIFAHLESGFDQFLTANADEPKVEYLLPEVLAGLTDAGQLEIHVVRTTEDWIGVTNPDDLEVARSVLAQRS